MLFGNMYFPEKLTEITENVDNPYRGWYRIVYFFADDVSESLIRQYNESRTKQLELAIINISAFRENEITDFGLNNIRMILDNYRKQQVTVILRLVYDHEGKVAEKEPAFFDEVCRHMEQLGRVIKDYSDVILVCQGLLIGNWGEMHSSRFSQKDKIRKLEDIFVKATDGKLALAVRKPLQWRYIRTERDYAEITDICRNQKEILKGRIGLFDDAIMASEDHLGTFGTKKREDAGWEEAWIPYDELVFEHEVGRLVPNGGEMVAPPDMTVNENFQNKLIDKMRSMQLTYLNEDYDKKILDALKSATYKKEGMSVYDYISRHLGYRFYVAGSYVKRDRKTHRLMMHIKMANSGFAGIYVKAGLFLVWKSNNGLEKEICILDNVMIHNGETIWECETSLRDELKKYNGNFYVYMKTADNSLDVDNGIKCQIIKLANVSDEKGRVRIGCIK